MYLADHEVAVLKELVHRLMSESVQPYYPFPLNPRRKRMVPRRKRIIKTKGKKK